MISLRFLKMALLMNLKLALSKKASFLLTIALVVLRQILFLATWSFFFGTYHAIHGWHFRDLLLMNGFVSFGIGFVELFFSGLRELPRLVESGGLDPFLIEPKNVILSIALSKGDVSGLGELTLSLLLFIISGYLGSSYGMILLLLPFAALFVFSLHLYLASLSFFIQNGSHFIRELFQNASVLAGQPNSAYRGVFRILTLTLIPVGFLSFFPVEYLRTHLVSYYFAALVGTVCFFWIASRLFYRGLKRYESGNAISRRY